MFDQSTFSITRGIAWVSILLYVFAAIDTLIAYQKWPQRTCSKERNVFWLFFFVLFAVTYAIDADFFHYKEIVYGTREVLGYGLEQVYQFIILYINNNYFLFRLIVFGGAVFIYYLLLSRFRLDGAAGILLMIVNFGGVFSYARATLAFTIFYLGLSFIIANSKDVVINRSLVSRTTGLLLGVGLILSSYFFHRSMILLIAFTPLAFLKLGKKSILSIIVLSPVVLFAARSLLGDVFSVLFYDEVIENRITRTYAEAANVEANWKGIISSILSYGRYVLCFIFISISIFRNKSNVSNEIKHLYSFYALISFFAVICYPLFEGNSLYMIRFLRMTIVPIIIIITYLYSCKLFSSNNLKWIIYISLLYALLTFARYLF